MISRGRLLGALGALMACLMARAPLSSATAAAPAWAPVATSGPTNLAPVQSETQRLGVDAEGGTFTLSFGTGGVVGVGTTAPILATASAAEVQAALNAITNISGLGAVSVLGGPGNKNSDHPYFITFDGGSLADTDVDPLSVDGSALSGGSTNTAVLTTTVPGGPGTTTIAVYAQNIGALPSSSSEPIEISVSLPPAVTTTETPGQGLSLPWSCSVGAGQSTFACTRTQAVGPGLPTKVLSIPVVVGAGAISGKPVKVSVSGGAAAAATYEMPLTISADPAPPGIQSFNAGAYDEDGLRDTRAGVHPANASTAIFVNSKRAPNGIVVASGEPKDITVDLPPGFLGNPIAVPACPEATDYSSCPTDSIVGVVRPITNSVCGCDGGGNENEAVVNVEAPFGYPGKFKFLAGGLGLKVLPVSVLAELRSDEDYGVTAGSLNTAQFIGVFGVFFDFWGAPAESGHDKQRCFAIDIPGGCGPAGIPSTAPNTAFLTSATNCAEEALTAPVTTLNLNTWQEPNLPPFTSSIALPPVTGCDQLHFESGFTFEPSETKSDSPASFRTELTVPSAGLTTPSLRTTPEIKTSVVKLPQGVVLNASGADGLGACSEAQIGLKNKINSTTGLPEPEPMPNPIRFTKDPNQCPDSAKIGTGELKSALLTETLQGDLYLAAQGNANPFGSLFAVYLVIENPARGIFIKLPGKVEPDPQTGQLTVTFDNLPQLPFTSLKLNLKGGNRSALASPTTCGDYTTTATNTPWSAPESGPPLVNEDSFTIDAGPNGTPCANTPEQRPFGLGLTAESSNPLAGAFTPFTMQLTRPDGAQELDTLAISTPTGFAAALKGVPYCPEAQIAAARQSTGKAEQASPACPAASQIGTTNTGAGSGPTPFYAKGKLYLAGPYKGAPLSVVAITPAVAGPFDLGDVVVRSALHVDPVTARVTATTDPIPQFLEGVALRIRDIRINLDRPNWALNPTSCDVKTVDVSVHGNSGATANLTNRFQVGSCEKLAFKPKLKAHLSGGTKRNDHPSLKATLTYPPGAGYANTRYAQVALPHSEFLDQAHINTVCTRPQFAAHQCPAGSIYGSAEAITPLLDEPLTGPAYLRSSANKLPDLVIALKGPPSQPIEIDLDGRIDSIHGGIRTTFEAAPDAPVSRFTLTMKGGKKGLLVNSRNLCTSKAARMTVRLIAHNNKRADQFPKLGNDCPKAKGRKGHKRHGSHRALAGWGRLGF